MFRQIARTVGVANLIAEPAPVLAARLEAAWQARVRGAGVPGLVNLRSTPARVVGDHLIYAYLIENTRVVEIVRRLIAGVIHDEKVSRPPQSPVTYAWLRSTEELFYSWGSSFLSFSPVSRLRPDPTATRCNAYARMFSMALNHGNDDGSPMTYHQPEVVNRDFVPTFETFLREVWRGIENAGNFNGPNPTDPASIANLALRLQNMLNERRGGSAVAANLAREEFAAVAATSWLGVLLSADNEVLVDFTSTGTSPENRLARLAARVGLPSHSHSHSYFILAPLMSLLLTEIEAGLYSDGPRARALFLPLAGAIPDRMRMIIDHWSRATGRNIKATAVTATPGTPLSRTNGKAQPAPAPLGV